MAVYMRIWHHLEFTSTILSQARNGREITQSEQKYKWKEIKTDVYVYVLCSYFLVTWAFSLTSPPYCPSKHSSIAIIHSHLHFIWVYRFFKPKKIWIFRKVEFSTLVVSFQCTQIEKYIFWNRIAMYFLFTKTLWHMIYKFNFEYFFYHS